MNQIEFMLWIQEAMYELYAILIFSMLLLCLTSIAYFYWFFSSLKHLRKYIR